MSYDKKNVQSTVVDDDADSISSETWAPTKAAFAEFLKRDFALANKNVGLAMNGTRIPLTLREIKEMTLHSVDVLERVLTSKIASGLVSEDKGRFSLTPRR